MKGMIRPEKLQQGDSVYLLNISRKGSVQLHHVIGVFESWGLKVIAGSTVTREGSCQFAATAVGHRPGRNVALNFGRQVELKMTANTLDICYK